MENDYKKDLEVHLHDLESGLTNQASLYMKYAELYADAIRERDRAKEALDLYKAEMDSKIRENPDKFGLTKSTETGIANCIIREGEYALRMDTFNNANYRANIMTGARMAFEHRKTALETLSKLYIGGYFSEVRMSEDMKKTFRDSVKEKELKEIVTNPRIKRIMKTVDTLTEV